MTIKNIINLILLSFIIICPLISQVNIVCVGNSITKGDQTEFPYPVRLNKLLGDNYKVYNYGYNGASVIKNLYPSYWDTQTFDLATGDNRDIVIILFGTNEALPSSWNVFGNWFEQDYNVMIQEFTKYNNPNRLFILLIPPAFLNNPAQDDILVNQIIPKIRIISQLTNSIIIDLYNPFINHPEWYVDGIHPNAIGHAYITQLIYNSIIQATPPGRPTSFNINQIKDQINLSWNRSIESDFIKNIVYRSSDPFLLESVDSVLTETYPPNSSYNFTNYSTNTIGYYYGVKAVDISGKISPISDVINFTINSRPVTIDTTLALYEDSTYLFKSNDFHFKDSEKDSIGSIYIIDAKDSQYFRYNGLNVNPPLIFDDINYFSFTPDLNDYSNSYAYFRYHLTDSFGSTSLDTNIVYINVLPVNDEPHLDSIDDVYILEDSHDIILPITGIHSGAPNEEQNLSIQVIPSDTSLINVSEIHYVSTDTSGSVVINPLENVYGSRPVTIRVWDDGGTENGGIDYTDESFYLYITPRNDPPSFDTIDNIKLTEDTDATIDLTGISAGPWEINQNISISVKSNNSAILPTPTIEYFSPNTSATLNFTTIPNVNGNTSVTITMSDDGGTEHGGKDSAFYTFPVEIVAVNDRPSDFNIVTPTADSTLVINKYNLNDTFVVSWDAAEDIDGDKIFYDIIFNDELSELTRIGVESTEIEYTLKEILAGTDTVSVTEYSYKVIASDGDLEILAKNVGYNLISDGRSFAPASLNLDQNFPNPFNNNTLIGFDLPKRSKVSLTIFDILGKEITKLIDSEYFERGYGTVTWNGLDANFVHVPAGIYFMQINVNSEIQHKKILLLK